MVHEDDAEYEQDATDFEDGVNQGVREKDDMESAMNKESTGMIKLAPKYLISSAKRSYGHNRDDDFDVRGHRDDNDGGQDEMERKANKDQRQDMTEMFKEQYLKLEEEIKLL